ncbi:MAG TPA: LLM class F420-dependent oxidoreductase [Anaerolineales bacterium]|nr:LLM class F420-dependent oxidoreductase [Anaerolineales bacterium]
MDLALMIEGQDGLNWDRWKRIAQTAEDLGFAGLYRSDHYTNPSPPELDSLELWVSLTYLATHTKRIEFGPLVTPFSFRHPSITARTAAAVDDLSGGRLRLGLGAGWNRREHEMFGLELLDVKGRMQRFAEGLEVVSKLLKSDKPFTFSGKFYQLNEAILLPRPKQPGGPPLVIGGNGRRRTLQLAAKYANEWNGTSQTPARFRDRTQRLDEYVAAEGRIPVEIRRTAMVGVAFGRNPRELQAKMGLYGRSRDQLLADGKLVGDGNQIAEQLNALAEAGCQRVMLQWLDQDDMDGLEALAKVVLPQFKPTTDKHR